MNITIYTKSNCPNCVSAKQLLHEKALQYTEFDVENPAWRSDLLERAPSVRQMPAIFINEQFVGGLVGLMAALVQLGL